MSKIEKYLYQLVRFEETSPKKAKLLNIDIVPSTWITFDVDSGKCVGKFMPPPYDDEQEVAAMHDLVRKCAPPPKTWPTYPLELRGQAKTYDDALLRLKILRKEKYAYTSDPDRKPQETAKELERSYRPKKQKIDLAKTQALFDVPKLGDKDIESESSFVICQSTEESFMKQSTKKSHRKKVRSPSISDDSSDCNDRDSRASSQASNAPPKSTRSKADPKKDCSKNKTDLHGTKNKLKSVRPGTPSTNASYINQPTSTHPAAGLQSTKDKNIVRALTSLSVDVAELVREVRSLRNVIEANNVAQNIQLPEEIEDMEIPLADMSKFVVWDEKLTKENAGFRNKVARALHLHIDRDGVLSKSIRSILKHYLSRRLLLLFTAVKKTEGKKVFNETNFCEVIMGVLNAQHARNGKSPLKKSVFYKQLGNVISNAVDWDGNRRKRRDRREANLKKRIDAIAADSENPLPETNNTYQRTDGASPRTDDYTSP